MAVAISSSVSLACGAADEPMPREPSPVPMSGERPRAMRNCPVAVPEARTRIDRTPDGVTLTITGDREVTRDEILARTERKLDTGVKRADPPAHGGSGGGPELAGHCPVILAGAAMTYELVPGGVRIHLRSREPLETGVLQGRVETRAQALRIPLAPSP